MKPYYSDEAVTIYLGDCREILPDLDPVETCITDPPYGLEFMGKDWDKLGDIGKASHAGPTKGADSDAVPGQRFRVTYNASGNRRCLSCGHWEWSGTPCRCKSPVWPNVKAHQAAIMQEWYREHFAVILDALLPGAPLLAFGGTRTHHRLMCGIEDAGFELRDCMMYFYIYGSGFPKSLQFGCKCGGNPIPYTHAEKTEHRVRPVRGADLQATEHDGEEPGQILLAGLPEPSPPPIGKRGPNPKLQGENNPAWRGGTYIEPDKGYRMVRAPDHLRARANGYVLEHILIAEKILGRPLRKGEEVHHIDRDKSNNDPSNLRVYSSHREHWVTEHLAEILSARSAAAS